MVADARPRRRNVPSAASVRTWTLGADAVIAGAVVLGCVVRIVQYAANRSLWLDESALALNIIDRSAGALLGPLAFSQAAPPGFLLIEKLATHLFGRGEYALRLFPLLCSLAALALFAVLARRVLGPWAAALATVLLASAGNLIYYGSEVKQYSTDVTATLVLLVLGVRLYEQPDRRRWTAAAFAAGCTVLFFSYAAVFPAIAIAVVLAVRELRRRPLRMTASLAVAVVWGLASVLVVVFSRHTTGSVQLAFKGAPGAYVTTSRSGILSSLREPPSALSRDIGVLPLPSAFYWAFALLALLGLAGLVRRRLTDASFFVGAVVLMLIASRLHRYPIADRTVLFLVPVAVIFVAEGVAVVAGVARRLRAQTALAVALGVAVLAMPGWRALVHLIHPQKHEEIKAAITQIRDGWQAGDTLYVSNPTEFALRYYLDCGCLTTPSWPFGRTNVGDSKQSTPLESRLPDLVTGDAPLPGRESYVTEVEKLRGRARVWLLYSHAGTDAELSFIRQQLPRKLAAFGRQRRVFLAHGVTLYLYDLR